MTNLLHIEWMEHFQNEVVEFDGVVLMDCYADRCGPCRMLGPIMEELQADNQDKSVKICKVDVDNAANQPIAAQFGVSSIPAVFVFKNGKVLQNMVGVQGKWTYQAKIDELLAGW